MSRRLVAAGPLGQPEEEADWQLAVGEPLVGWRLWRVAADDGGVVLRSVYKYRVVWPARAALEAECYCPSARRGPHRAPGFEAGQECGIYALRSRHLTGIWASFANERESRTVGKALGRVKLWGRVILYEQGFKAEYGYPADLTLLEVAQGSNPWAIAEQIEAGYGIPVEIA